MPFTLSLFIISATLTASAKTSNNDCIFRSFDSCTEQYECCRVRVHEDYLCLDKGFLYENYKMRYQEQFKEIQTEQGQGQPLFNYRAKNNACIKWLEINKSLYSDLNIEYSCQCEGETKKILGWGLIIGVVSAMLAF